MPQESPIKAGFRDPLDQTSRILTSDRARLIRGEPKKFFYLLRAIV